MKIVGWILLALLAAALLYILFLQVCNLLVNPQKEYDHCDRFYFRVLNSAAFCSFRLARLKIRLEGAEKVPWDRRFLLVSNHCSNFDPIITWYLLRKNNMAFVSKQENFKVPLFGRMIRKCCFLAIDREDPKASLRTIMKAADLMKRNEASVGIYPEGTRNRTPEKGLLPFHNGVFKMAQMAKAPIVVAALHGTDKIHKNYPWRGTKVSLEILEVIPAEEAAGKRTAEIGEQVEALLKDALEGDHFVS
ncbi:MAG: 1-acyl-sn-glycerol-3-phosphate acyltransferase [Butyrivibrio sp.]|nr:1-acyl-sn-glycerol-3-phosphate acyltransferase [Acetatifactor muris]MCM1560151.1 1-acyl-sn-glycerol-3-phosphate acyltransferase [Butyrivibrio sp.]